MLELGGIPVNVYIMFWSKLSEYIEWLTNKIVKDKCIHDVARKGIILPINKKNWDLLFVKIPGVLHAFEEKC